MNKGLLVCDISHAGPRDMLTFICRELLHYSNRWMQQWIGARNEGRR